MTKIISGLSSIAQEFDAIILDIWGVLHGGVRAFEGVTDALATLRDQGKPVGLLSNAPRRSRFAIERVTATGIASDLYGPVMTSGESVRLYLEDCANGLKPSLGTSCYYLGPRADTNMFEGLDIVLAPDLDQADFILNVGLFSESDPLETYDDLLRAPLARKVPMICANPDRWVDRQDIGRVPCAGLIAERYEQAGGKVHWHGKPDPGIYLSLRNIMDPEGQMRFAMVGDSMTTDMPGAIAADMTSILMTRGLHAAHLHAHDDNVTEQAALDRLCSQHGVVPDYALARLNW